MDEEIGNSALLLGLVDTTCAVIADRFQKTGGKASSLQSIWKRLRLQMSVFQGRIFEVLSPETAAENKNPITKPERKAPAHLSIIYAGRSSAPSSLQVHSHSARLKQDSGPGAFQDGLTGNFSLELWATCQSQSQ